MESETLNLCIGILCNAAVIGTMIYLYYKRKNL